MRIKQFAQLVLSLFLLSTLLVGCNEQEASTSDITPPTVTAPTVSPLTVSPLAVSLMPTPVPLPIRGPDFYLDSIGAGDTVVRGTGPANISINIVDVSWGGTVIGIGTIGIDGTFTIEVPPIEGGNRIGIMLADLNDSGFKYEDFRNNENYQDLPMVGLLVYYLDVPTE